MRFGSRSDAATGLENECATSSLSSIKAVCRPPSTSKSKSNKGKAAFGRPPFPLRLSGPVKNQFRNEGPPKAAHTEFRLQMFSIELLREAMAELPGSKPSARATIGRPPKCDVIDGGLRTPTSQVTARTIQRKEKKSILFCDT